MGKEENLGFLVGGRRRESNFMSFLFILKNRVSIGNKVGLEVT